MKAKPQKKESIQKSEEVISVVAGLEGGEFNFTPGKIEGSIHCTSVQ